MHYLAFSTCTGSFPVSSSAPVDGFSLIWIMTYDHPKDMYVSDLDLQTYQIYVVLYAFQSKQCFIMTGLAQRTKPINK